MPTEPSAVGVWVKLRRRKVVQWGIAYAAGAWALLQGIDFLVEAFHWPDATRPLASLVLLLGLPVAVALAWYHGDRGEQRVNTTEATIIALLLLLGGGFIWVYQHQAEPAAAVVRAEQASTSPGVPAPLDGRPSIAVLPFENRSRLEDDVFFVDGIHDDILTQLTKVSALKVISRTSVERFRNTELSLQQIAQQLGVTSVLEGGVQRAGDRVRINVQLIDAGTDNHLWAESYDRELTAANIFTIQSEVAAAIAAALQASLTPAETARVNAIPTENLQAWESYQLGKQRMVRRTEEAMDEALANFRAAIAADPGFALAWVGLADTLIIQRFYGYAPADASLAGATEAIDRALALDPNLAPAHVSRGEAHRIRRDYEAAELAFRKAIELNPNYPTAYHWYALLLFDLGRLDESLQAAQRAVALDPLSSLFRNVEAVALEGLGRFEQAAARFREAMELDPAMPLLPVNMADLQAWAFGRVDEAVQWAERGMALDPGADYTPLTLSMFYLHLGDPARAAQWLDRASQQGADGVYLSNQAAELHLYRGERAQAVVYASRAFAADALAADLFILRDADLSGGNWQAARARYAQVFPELLAAAPPAISTRNYRAAIELVPVLQASGEFERADQLLDRSERFIHTIPRLGMFGHGIADVRIFTLRGQAEQALTALREATQQGWRAYWWYYLKHDPELAPIRDAPEFKAVVAAIERDMAEQRARLEARANPLQ
jgi:TolB-like protein/Tfp pilus assembly protein PilF